MASMHIIVLLMVVVAIAVNSAMMQLMQ